MSATLRYDIGHSTAKAITDENIFAFLGMNLHEVNRWGGHMKGYRACQCFSIKTPGQIGDAVQLREWALKAASKATSGVVGNGCKTLARRIEQAVGLPGILSSSEAVGLLVVNGSGEGGFVSALLSEPHELVNWMAYADWLSEQPGAYERKRGELIVALFAKNAIKVKNGILPELAIEANNLIGIR